MIIFYIRVIKPASEFFQHTRTRFFNRERALTTRTVGNLGISGSSLGVLEKFHYRLNPPHIKYNNEVLVFETYLFML